MLGGLRRHKPVAVRDRILAARVGARRRGALPLQAAIRRVARRSAGGDAFEGPEKQERDHQTNRDVKSTSHLAPEYHARSVPFVSGSVKMSAAPITKNAELSASPAPKPCRSAMAPTAKGARALAARPVL